MSNLFPALNSKENVIETGCKGREEYINKSHTAKQLMYSLEVNLQLRLGEHHFFGLTKLQKNALIDCILFHCRCCLFAFYCGVHRQTIGIPIGTNFAPLVADLFLFCYERDFMKSLSRENQADIVEAFNSTSRYLDDLLNIDNIYFDQMVDRIYPTELQLNRANSSDTEASFFYLNLCLSNGTVSTKIYEKRDDFDFDIVNFPFLDGDVPRRTSYGVYISQLIRFARGSSNLSDFNYRNKALTAKLLRQGYRYFKFRKALSKFYRALVEKNIASV